MTKREAYIEVYARILGGYVGRLSPILDDKTVPTRIREFAHHTAMHAVENMPTESIDLSGENLKELIKDYDAYIKFLTRGEPTSNPIERIFREAIANIKAKEGLV